MPEVLKRLVCGFVSWPSAPVAGVAVFDDVRDQRIRLKHGLIGCVVSTQEFVHGRAAPDSVMDECKLSRKIALQFVKFVQIRSRLEPPVNSFCAPIDRLHLNPRSLR